MALVRKSYMVDPDDIGKLQDILDFEETPEETEAHLVRNAIRDFIRHRTAAHELRTETQPGK